MSRRFGERTYSSISRRELLAYSAAATALAGCARAPRGKIIPYASAPSDVRPGVPIQYATAHEVDGRAVGLIVAARDGRPIKVEGNPAHPSSLGATRIFDQTLVTSLFDPNRARGPAHRGEPTTWEAFEKAFLPNASTSHPKLSILLPRTSSPLIGSLLASVRRKHTGAQVYFSSPLEPERAWSATKLAFGDVLEVVLEPGEASVVLALGSDFLASGPAYLRYARQWSRARRDRMGDARMPRLYVVESRKTSTGAVADHRLPATLADTMAIAREIARAVIAAKGASPTKDALRAIADFRADAELSRAPFVTACARDLIAAGEAALVVVGDDAPLELQVLGHCLNDALGSRARRLIRSPILGADDEATSLRALADRLAGGDVERLILLDVNPLSSAPSLDFDSLMKRAGSSAHVGLYENESTAASAWFLPMAHPLESWGDTRAHDGTVSVVQPLIEPLFGGRTTAELLAWLGAVLPRRGLDLARASSLERRLSRSGPDDGWEDSLRTGVEPETTFSTERPELRDGDVAEVLRKWEIRRSALEIHLHADVAIYDGRFADERRLLEVSEPFTKVAWTNHASMSEATAHSAGLRDGSTVRLHTAGGAIALPVAVVAGQADGVVSVAVGWGQGQGRAPGANAYRLQRVLSDTVVAGELEAMRQPAVLPRTQETTSIADRREKDIVRLRRSGEEPMAAEPRRLTLYDAEPPPGRAWGMTIDLGACIGCNACVVACQVENNVPVVGPTGVVEGRVMHWLRIDRYLVSDRGTAVDVFMPMLCQHCEKAPCEYVCPVKATVHSEDGINEMVYNRCVGTRFCSNNCPYKVRRFNWFNYHEDESDLAALAENPEVTVRTRGVMEKCTFCVQRIRAAEHVAVVAARPLARDEVVTACASVCPTEAIVFGDLSDPGSRVSASRAKPDSYAALGDVGTEPRVRYLPRRRNPNPELP